MSRLLFLANGLPLRALTVRQFCKMYSLSRQTCYSLINSGRLQSVLCGGRRLILADSAEKLLRGSGSTDAEAMEAMLNLQRRFMCPEGLA
jgi:excisionase family DNA binding protein